MAGHYSTTSNCVDCHLKHPWLAVNGVALLMACVSPCYCLQVARIDDNIIAATSSSTGAICMLMMQLPPIPGATTADLQVRGGTGANSLP